MAINGPADPCRAAAPSSGTLQGLAVMMFHMTHVPTCNPPEAHAASYGLSPTLSVRCLRCNVYCI
jgi:hypothetical protein